MVRDLASSHCLWFKKVPEDVTSANTCIHFSGYSDILEDSPSISQLEDISTRSIFDHSGNFPPSATIEISSSLEPFSVDYPGQFVDFLGKTFKDDPTLSKEVEILSNTIDDLKESMKSQDRTIIELKQRFQDDLEKALNSSKESISELQQRSQNQFDGLRDSIGDEKIEEIVGKYIVEFEKPSLMDMREVHTNLSSTKKIITHLNMSVEKIHARQEELTDRIKEVEKHIVRYRTFRTVLSHILSFILGVIITGISGWILLSGR
ncbi:MAG: hypothetical protein ACW98G_15410 [Candidatus Hodarchaeales archaeon]